MKYAGFSLALVDELATFLMTKHTMAEVEGLVNQIRAVPLIEVPDKVVLLKETDGAQ